MKGNNGHILQMKPLADEMLGGASRSIWVLQAAVGLVLLIACANLANLLLARAETRQREFAVLTALGASRGRLVRKFMSESLLLSLAGGILGVLLARIGVRALVRAYPTSLPRTSEVAVDPMVLLFTLGIAVASGVIFGLAPLALTRVKGLVTALKESGGKGSTNAARHYIRRALVAAEVALAVMVVIGAGLLVRTVYNLMAVDAGFDPSRVVTFAITLPQATSEPGSRGRTYQNILDTLRAVPGVQAASAMSGLPPTRPLNANDTEIDNYTAPPEGPYENVDYYQNVMSDYFETMGIPIVQGRAFQPIDAASGGMVTVVNERLVNTFWKGLNPVGQRLRPCCGDQVPWFTVVGVAKDVKQGGVDRDTGTELYFFVEQLARLPPPRSQAPATMNIVLRTTLAPAALAQTIERVVRTADPAVPGRAPSRDGQRVRGVDSAPAAARATAGGVRRPRLAARGHRHLRRALLHGRRAPPRDWHSHGARRASVGRGLPRHEAGTGADRSRDRPRARGRTGPEPAHRVAPVRHSANRSGDARRIGHSGPILIGRRRSRCGLPAGARRGSIPSVAPEYRS